MQLKFFFIFFCGWTCDVAAKGATCDFGVSNELFYPVYVDVYTCSIESFDLSGSNEQNEITGAHEADKNDDDVKAVYCLNCTAPIPLFDTNFCNKFKNLEGINMLFLEIEKFDIKTFENCQNMKYLRFEEHKIVEIQENLLLDMPKLTWLAFLYNEISSIAPNTFKNQKELVYLDLGSNRLSSLPPKVFEPLINLKELWLGNNQLTTIHSDSFGIHRQLTVVNFWGNKIDAIDEKFIENTAVDELNMKRNICYVRKISNRREMKQKLQKCFENYQPREVTVTLATPTEQNTGTL